MYVNEVIPITKAKTPETLTYFSEEEIPLLSLVTVPLRKKEIKALTINSQKAIDQKTNLKKRGYSLKKVTSVSKESVFGDNLLKVLEWTSDYYACPLSKVLFEVLPIDLLDKIKKRESVKGSGFKKLQSIEGSYSKRLRYYESQIKRNIESGNSVFILTPTIKSCARTAQILKSDGFKVLEFHGSLGKKEKEGVWEEIHSQEKVIVVSTPIGIASKRDDFGLLIIEEQNSPFYKTISKPRINLSVVAEKLFEKREIPVIYGDWLLSPKACLESEVERLETTKGSLKIKLDSLEREEDEKFSMIGPNLTKALKNFEEGENIFIYVNRTGIANTLLCGDCGKTVSCNKCDSPVSLYQEDGKRIFACGSCGEKRGAKEACANCGSWNLKGYGITVESIGDEINKINPKIKVFSVSKDSTPKEKDLKKILSRWQKEGGVLIGTLRALLGLETSQKSVVASAESLMAPAGYKGEGELLRTLLYLKDKTKHEIIIQSHDPDLEVLYEFLENKIDNFHKRQMDLLKKYGYPPFKTLIKISAPDIQKEKVLKLEKKLESLSPDSFSSPATKTKPQTYNLILKIDNSLWPLKNESFILKNLSSEWNIEVNPSSIL